MPSINCLPTELLIQVLDGFRPKDLWIHARLVNREWHTLATELALVKTQFIFSNIQRLQDVIRHVDAHPHPAFAPQVVNFQMFDMQNLNEAARGLGLVETLVARWQNVRCLRMSLPALSSMSGAFNVAQLATIKKMVQLPREQLLVEGVWFSRYIIPHLTSSTLTSFTGYYQAIDGKLNQIVSILRQLPQLQFLSLCFTTLHVDHRPLVIYNREALIQQPQQTTLKTMLLRGGQIDPFTLTKPEVMQLLVFFSWLAPQLELLDISLPSWGSGLRHVGQAEAATVVPAHFPLQCLSFPKRVMVNTTATVETDTSPAQSLAPYMNPRHPPTRFDLQGPAASLRSWMAQLPCATITTLSLFPSPSESAPFATIPLSLLLNNLPSLTHLALYRFKLADVDEQLRDVHPKPRLQYLELNVCVLDTIDAFERAVLDTPTLSRIKLNGLVSEHWQFGMDPLFFPKTRSAITMYHLFSEPKYDDYAATAVWYSLPFTGHLSLLDRLNIETPRVQMVLQDDATAIGAPVQIWLRCMAPRAAGERVIQGIQEQNPSVEHKKLSDAEVQEVLQNIDAFQQQLTSGRVSLIKAPSETSTPLVHDTLDLMINHLAVTFYACRSASVSFDCEF
ncbi:hypothetical protein BC940DRAFT_343041 [Gongronella butleri]|nr:hypothetical protein BC940DRAFT_343041 [Gongronella butleri]